MIVSDVRNPFFTALVRGIEDVASAAGYSVVLCNSDENPAKEANYIGVALTEQMAGVIISLSSSTVTEVTQMVDSGFPVVLVDRELEGVQADAVQVDNEHGAWLATTHLMDQGYQRIACITGPERVSTAAQRLSGYCRALREAGHDPDDALVRHADFRERGGRAAIASLLDDGQPPDAVFVTNNLMTMGVLECLTQRDIAMPEELALACFDELPWTDLVRPTVTTITQPTYREGRAAADLLVQRIRDPSRIPTRIVLETILQVGETTAAVRRAAS